MVAKRSGSREHFDVRTVVAGLEPPTNRAIGAHHFATNSLARLEQAHAMSRNATARNRKKDDQELIVGRIPGRAYFDAPTSRFAVVAPGL